MNIRQSIFVTMCLGFGLLTGVELQAAPREIRLKIGNLFTDDRGPSAPLQVLADALQRDKRSRLFRVTWKLFASNFVSDMTALYDRQQQTLTYHSRANFPYDQGSEKREPRNQTQTQTFHFTGVTDRLLFRLAAQNSKGFDAKNEFLSALTRAGCKRRRVGYNLRIDN